MFNVKEKQYTSAAGITLDLKTVVGKGQSYIKPINQLAPSLFKLGMCHLYYCIPYSHC